MLLERECCGDVGGWWFGWALSPLAAPLPSPWDPLLISPWEGEGDGSRERGWLLWEGVAAVNGEAGGVGGDRGCYDRLVDGFSWLKGTSVAQHKYQ